MFNGYVSTYNPQASIDKINGQIAELERMKQQIPSIPQPTNLTQNFQLAPNSQNMRFVDSIDEVNKDTVYVDTPYFSKDMSVLWVKNPKNEVKTYELQELVIKDEKDLRIEFLMAQIEELKKGSVKNESSNATKNVSDDDGATESKKSYNGKQSSKYDK